MQSIGHIGAAADVLGDTLQIQRRVLGPNHPDTQATALVLDDLGFYLPFMRYLVPMAICPMYYIGCGVKLAFKSVRGLFVAMEIGSLPDVTLIHDNLDENSIDEYNARQLLRGVWIILNLISNVLEPYFLQAALHWQTNVLSLRLFAR